MPFIPWIRAFPVAFPRQKEIGLYTKKVPNNQNMGKMRKRVENLNLRFHTQGPRTGWWFQIFFYFHPCLGKIPILPNIFQMGWNHQLEDRLFFKEDVWNQQLRSKKDSFQHLNRNILNRSLLQTMITNQMILNRSHNHASLRISDWTHQKKEWFGLGCISSLH